MNVFGNTQCQLCYKTFKVIKGYVLKTHYDCFHSNKNRFSDRKKEELFLKQKKYFFGKTGELES